MSFTLKEYKALYPQLLAYAISLCKDRNIAEDLVSETILKAVEAGENKAKIDNLSAWCVRVLRNKYIDKIRKKGEQQFDPEHPEDENISGSNLGADTFSNILFSECMQRIKPQIRNVLIMNVIEGITSKEIALLEDISQNTVLTWLAKAKLEFFNCFVENS